MTMYSTNPAYEQVFTHGSYRIFIPTKVTAYHKSREVEASIQNIYSNAGATADLIRELCDEGIKMLEEDKDAKRVRQNMFAILNNLRYRTKHPVDSLCGVRMGAILTYMESEEGAEPENATGEWIDKKVRMAIATPELYDFFLHWGIINTPAYEKLSNTLTDTDYFHRREQILQSFKP